jgi:Glycosyl hydrolases family 43
MAGITRKQFLEQFAAGCLAGALPLRSFAAATAAPAAANGPLMIPYPAKPWAQATRIVGERPQLRLADIEGKLPSFDRLPLYNDFCMVSDADGRWHCVGILFEGHSAQDFRQDRLFHYMADSIEGPYHSLGYLDLGYGKSAGVWAPCIVRNGHRALIYYASVSDKGASIRVAESTDPQMRSWHRGAGGKEILITEDGDRDPEVIKDRRTGHYLMYYVAGDGNTDVVKVRTSTDLLTWTEPRTVLGTPTGYQASESVFVLQENGYYYLWISGSADYSRMSLYISTDPFNFGDADRNRIEEQPGHAAEIVHAQGKYWMACVAIATVAGLPHDNPDIGIGQHDLEGVYVQPLEWRTARPEMLSKVSGIRRRS